MTHVTLAAFLGGWEITLILIALLFSLAVVGGVVFLIVHFSRKSKNPPPPITPATQILPRKCPQCGAQLKPDVSEGLCPACLLQRGIATEDGGGGATATFSPPPLPDLAKLFPQLEIIELIGKGGMGAVYKARQPALDRFVALKILAPRSGSDLDFASRFTREARALAKLSHPNIVAVYDFGQIGSRRREEADPAKVQPLPPPHVGGYEEGALSYFIMEYVDGPNLRQVEQAGKLSPREALEIIPQICTALQFAHDEGIVHRDIKPENILLDKKGRVKIADFGLAKILGQEPKDFRLTGARDIMGTPHYMAPEQVEKPQAVDHRADIYSLGVVFYEMLTGELPLGKFQPPSSCARGMQIDVRLDEVVLHALEKAPERRYQQASQVKTAVETIATTTAPGGSRREEAPSSQSEIEPHFSRTAIAGACWAPFALLIWFLFHQIGVGSITIGLKLAAVFLLSLSFTAPFGTTILGWIAMSQIRRAAGRLYGLRLAVFDGLLFPLLALDSLIIGGFLLVMKILSQVSLSHAGPGEIIPPMWTNYWWLGLAALMISVLIDFLIIRRVWHAIKKPAATNTAPIVPKPDHFWRWFFAVVIAGLVFIPVAIAILGLLAAIAIPNFVKARQHAQALVEQNATNSSARASAETWSPTLAPGEKPDLQKIRGEVKSLMEQGRYEEALQRQLWYFNHALEYGEVDPVRLSFGIMDWDELGRRYPKAKQALTEIRDFKTREIVEGRGYSEMFQEVQAINGELQDDDATYALFTIIRKKDPKLADKCYFYLENLLVAKGEYQWCFSHIGDPQERFDSISHMLEMDRAREKRTAETRQNGWTNSDASPHMSEMIMRSDNDRFVGQTRQLIEILVGTNHKTDAEKIQAQAILILDDPRLKSAVSDAEAQVQKVKAASGSADGHPTSHFVTRLTQIFKPASTSTNVIVPPPILKSDGEPGPIDPATGLPVGTNGTSSIDLATGLPIGPGGTSVIDPATGLPDTWHARVEQLKQRLEQNPQAGIPELKFLTAYDWLEAAKDDLKTDADYRRALNRLRVAGETHFIDSQLQPALKIYVKVNHGQFPANLAQLQPFFQPPVDEAILQRYEIVPHEKVPDAHWGGDWVVTQKSPVDKDYDRRLVVGAEGGWGRIPF